LFKLTYYIEGDVCHVHVYKCDNQKSKITLSLVII